MINPNISDAERKERIRMYLEGPLVPSTAPAFKAPELKRVSLQNHSLQGLHGFSDC